MTERVRSGLVVLAILLAVPGSAQPESPQPGTQPGAEQPGAEQPELEKAELEKAELEKAEAEKAEAEKAEAEKDEDASARKLEKQEFASRDEVKTVEGKVKEEAQSIWKYFSAGFLTNVFFNNPNQTAVIRNGYVRLTEVQWATVGVGLQAAYTWSPLEVLRYREQDDTWIAYSHHAVGPYAGVSIATGDVIDTFALGLVYEYQRRNGGIRLGLGAVLDPDTQFLSAEFRPHHPVPEGAEGIEYRINPSIGMQVVLSFTPGFGDGD